MIGKSLGHFRVVEKIGAGGVGVVYRAQDEHLNRDVAIKVLSQGTFSDELARKHFRREALILSKLNHPNIETVHEFSTENGVDFLVMEYISGTTLSAVVAQGPLPEKEILRLGVQMAEGLVAAHEKEVLHRDLKPANIRVTSDGRLKILDFGLAKLVPRNLETAITESMDDSEKAAGTLPYMAPEQVLCEKLDSRTDIYSAGVVLYEMATGQRPFTEKQVPLLVEAILHRQPQEFPYGISYGLRNVILKCLDKDANHRYQSARELKVDLERLIAPSSVSLPPPSITQRRKLQRYALAFAVVLLAAIGILILKGWDVFQDSSRPGQLPVEKHIAVLPFSSVGASRSTRAFCDGLTESLTSELTQLTQFQESFWVVPSTEIRNERIMSAREARKIFGATLVMTGSCMQKSEGRLYLVVNLVDAKALRQLRAMNFETQIDDLALQHENVVRQIAEMLELEQQPPGKRLGDGGGTSVAAAYNYYLQGLGYLYRYDKAEDLESAIHSFQQALEKDPQFALAYAGLAKAYWQKYDLTGDSSWVEPARTSSLRAVELNDQMVPVRVTLGAIQTGTGNYQDAVLEFQQALKLDPSNFDAHLGLARAYEAMGELGKAESSYRAAIKQQPNVWYGYNSLGGFFANSSRLPEAAEMFERVVQLHPDSARGYSNLGAIYSELGRYNQAISASKKSIEIRPTSDGYWSLGYTYFMLRRFPEAASAYEQAVRLRERKHYSILGGLGDAYYWSPGQREKARSAYEEAVVLANDELKINPAGANALIMLAHFHAKLGETDQSLDKLHQALNRKPDNPHFLYFAGLVYNELGQPSIAINMLKQAVEAGYSRTELNRIDFDNLRRQSDFQSLVKTKS